MLLVRQVGMVVGPAGILFLQKINFKIGSVTVDKYSSAGLVLAVCWKRFHEHAARLVNVRQFCGL